MNNTSAFEMIFKIVLWGNSERSQWFSWSVLVWITVKNLGSTRDCKFWNSNGSHIWNRPLVHDSNYYLLSLDFFPISTCSINMFQLWPGQQFFRIDMFQIEWCLPIHEKQSFVIYPSPHFFRMFRNNRSILVFDANFYRSQFAATFCNQNTTLPGCFKHTFSLLVFYWFSKQTFFIIMQTHTWKRRFSIKPLMLWFLYFWIEH